MESCDIEADPESGAGIRACTSAPAITHDVYCEQPYCSADGNRLAMMRFWDTNPTAPRDLLVYDIARYKIAHLVSDMVGLANAAWSGVLFVIAGKGAGRRLLRVDMNTLDVEERFAWGDLPVSGLSSVSGDNRWGATAKQLDERTFGIYKIDLHSGRAELIHQSPDIGNPHLQFRLHSGARLLIQENRGCLVDFATGDWIRPCDERGVGLYSIALDGSDRKDFPVGPPYTPATTGHECWIGDTDRVLVTTSKVTTIDGKTGNILEVAHDRPKARVVYESDKVWNHISATRCGKYFVTDSYQLPGVPILIGSIASGKARTLCHAKTSGGGGQYTHAHPYMTSDNRYVLFNSDRTGLANIHIASIPDGFLNSLD
jgi:hypothetical protein